MLTLLTISIIHYWSSVLELLALPTILPAQWQHAAEEHRHAHQGDRQHRPVYLLGEVEVRFAAPCERRVVIKQD